MVAHASGDLVINNSRFIDNLADKGNIVHNAINANLTLLNSIFEGDCFKGGTITNNYGSLYLHNNEIDCDSSEIYSYGGKITSHVFAYILSNETHYVHLNESIVIYFEFYDDNDNLIRFDDFDLFVNNTKIDYIFNERKNQYEANFTADKLESYAVYITSAHLTNLTSKNGEIVVVNVTDDFSALKKLIDNANGTVTLDKNYTFNNLTDADFEKGIKINNNITIDGAGFTIDAIGQARIFDVQSSNVTFRNISFVNGRISHADGGAIYWKGDDGSVIDCSFSYNRARYGSSINWKGDRGRVINCTFINNYAVSDSIIEYEGNYFQVLGSTFINNTAGTSGGAISCGGDNTRISDCIFINNIAKFYCAGAIDLYRSNDCTISNCIFENNHAPELGGAIYLAYDNNIDIYDCSFIGNSAKDGGAIFSADSKNDKIYNCNFTDNLANYGGAISWMTDTRPGFHAINATVYNDNFINNSASFGGALNCNCNDSNVFDCSFENNLADNGGAIFWNKTGKLSNCSFVSNDADLGGAIYAFAELNLATSRFSENNATIGGAIFSIDYSEIVNSTFDSNYANSAGAVYSAYVDIVNSNFTNHHVGFGNFPWGDETFTQSGGAVYGYEGYVENSNFINNI